MTAGVFDEPWLAVTIAGVVALLVFMFIVMHSVAVEH